MSVSGAPRTLSSTRSPVIADVDSLGPNAPGIRNRLANSPHCMGSLPTPTIGVRAGLACDPQRPHEESHDALAAYLKNIYDVEIGPHFRSVVPTSVASHDPEAYIAVSVVSYIPYQVASNTPLDASAVPAQATSPVSTGLLSAIPVDLVPTIPSTAASSTASTPLSADDVWEVLRWVPTAPDYDTWLRVVSAVA